MIMQNNGAIGSYYSDIKSIFVRTCNTVWTMADLNRLKVVLVENKRTSKWLAEQLHKDPATVSKWCTNSAQPSLETLVEIAKVLDVDARELIISTSDNHLHIL
jgi:transcriptional regulator with XRE-family HTH domain